MLAGGSTLIPFRETARVFLMKRYAWIMLEVFTKNSYLEYLLGNRYMACSKTRIICFAISSIVFDLNLIVYNAIEVFDVGQYLQQWYGAEA